MFSFLRKFCGDEDGAIAVVFASFLFVLVGFAALAIDISYTFATRTNLQSTASAAALAGVQAITDPDGNGVDDTNEYRRMAVEYAYRNMPFSAHKNIVEAICGEYLPGPGTVINDAECTDVKVGNWDPDTRTFTAWDNGFNPDSMDLDAVRVRAHRSDNNGNPLGLFLAPAVGLAQTSINVHAIAWADSDTPWDCFQRGIISSGTVDPDSNNDFTESMCVYGELGVKLQSDNCFEGEFTTCGSSETPIDGYVQVKKSEYGDWDEQGGSNSGFEYAKQPDGYMSPQIASQIEDFIQVIDDGFTTGTWSGQEGFDYSFADPGIGPSIVGSLPDPLVSGSYEVLGTADIPEGDYTGVPLAIKADIIKIPSNTTLDHVILMAETEIDIGSGFNITNSVFASNDLLKFGSDGNLGGADCDPNGVNFAAYSQGKLTIQSNTNFRNAHLITNYDVDVFDLQSDNIYQGVTIQAIGDIFLGSNNQFSGCPQTGDGEITGTVAGLYLRLVD